MKEYIFEENENSDILERSKEMWNFLIEVDKKLDIGIFKDSILNVPGMVLSYAWALYGDRYQNGAHGKEHIFQVIENGFAILKYGMENEAGIAFYNTYMQNHGCGEKIDFYIAIGLAAIFHDLFQDEDRKKHQQRSHNLLIDIKNRKSFNPVWMDDIWRFDMEYGFIVSDGMLDLVALMCLEHRASYNKPFSNIMCEIFSAADRDKPDLFSIMKRSYLHNLDCLKKDHNYEMEIKDFETTFEIPVNRIVDMGVDVLESSTIKFTINSKYKYNELISEGVPKEFANAYIHVWEKYSRDGYVFNNMSINNLYFKYYRKNISKLFDDIDAYLKDSNLFIKLINKVRDHVIYDLMGIEIGRKNG